MCKHALILVLQNFLRVILQLCHTLCVQKIVIWDSIHALVHLYVCTRPHTGVTKLFSSYSTILSYLICTQNCYFRLYPRSRTSVWTYTSSYWCYKIFYESFYNLHIQCLHKISLLLPPITLMYICMCVHVLILVLQNFLRVILQFAHTMFTKNITNSDSIHAHVHFYVCTCPHTCATKLFTSHSTICTYSVYKKYH
jgi:hypothetical protein